MELGKIRNFAFDAVIWLGALACVFVWLDVKPNDLWGWHLPLALPHLTWLFIAVTLFVAGISSSSYSLYCSLQDKTPPQSNFPEPTLKIIRAVYGAGPTAEIDITDKLNNAPRNGLVVFVDNTLVPRDPAWGVRKRLDIDYCYGSNSAVRVSRWEALPGEIVRLVLPEDTEVLKVKAQLPTTTKSSEVSLRDRVFDACSDLELLLKKHGKRPNPYLIPISDENEYTRTYNETVQTWDNKFQADYWKNYKDNIVDLRHELALRELIDDALDERLSEAQSAALSDVTVQEIDRSLRLLAARL